MEPIALLVQRNPWVLGVLLVGLPSLTWAAAYGARPSRARRRMALGALALTLGLGVVGAIVEARAREPWWPSLVVAAVIALGALLLLARARRR